MRRQMKALHIRIFSEQAQQSIILLNCSYHPYMQSLLHTEACRNLFASAMVQKFQWDDELLEDRMGYLRDIEARHRLEERVPDFALRRQGGCRLGDQLAYRILSLGIVVGRRRVSWWLRLRGSRLVLRLSFLRAVSALVAADLHHQNQTKNACLLLLKNEE